MSKSAFEVRGVSEEEVEEEEEEKKEEEGERKGVK